MPKLYPSGDGNFYSEDGTNVHIFDKEGAFEVRIGEHAVDEDTDLDALTTRQGITICGIDDD